MSETCRTHGGD